MKADCCLERWLIVYFSSLVAGQTIEAPTIEVTTFHPEEKLYTILVVDLDYPDQQTKSFRTFAHWLV